MIFKPAISSIPQTHSLNLPRISQFYLSQNRCIYIQFCLIGSSNYASRKNASSWGCPHVAYEDITNIREQVTLPAVRSRPLGYMVNLINFAS